MPLNFSEALASLKKKAQLAGRPISQQEVTGVAAGYSESAASRLGKMKTLELQKQRHDETLAEQKRQYDLKMAQDYKDRHAAEDASRRESQASGFVSGAMAGGMATGSPYGAIVGGIIGGIAGSCIIISACTSKESQEVEIAREFRDKYMSGYHLGGYYALAEAFVPLIKRFSFLRLITKRFLVDRLVDYGEWILGYKLKRHYRSSKIVTEQFLSLCASVGMRINIQPYIEAHR